MRNVTFTIITLLLIGFGFQTLNAQEETPFKKTLKMEGRIMYDFDFLSKFHNNDGDIVSFSGNEFRRVRLAAKGGVFKNINYKVEFDFAGGAVNFRDVYLKFLFPGNSGNVLVGSFTEPTSFNNMTSSKNITFFERAMMVNTQPHKYNAGFMYDNQKLFDGKIGVQLAHTFNGYNNAGDAFKDEDISGGATNFIGRLTGVVLNNKEKKQVVHLGVNYEHRGNNSDEYVYKFRTENHMGDKFSSYLPYIDSDGELVRTIGDFKNTSDIGFEVASTFGSLSLQSEYELSSIITEVDTYKAAGYYAFVSFFVTGEHRPYKNSTFGRVKPKADFCINDGKFGALELVARYSVMDFSAYPGVTDTQKIANISAGFNWYLNNNTRIMYNYTNGDFNDLAIYGDDNLTGHLIRFQVDF